MYWSSSGWLAPYDGEVETIRLRVHPLKAERGPFGYTKCADGKDWDFNGYIDGCVLARRIVLGYDPWYSNVTNTVPCGTREWRPYKVEIVGDEDVQSYVDSGAEVDD